MVSNYPTFLVKEFPDFSNNKFNPETYRSRFSNGNFIIHARSKDLEYGSHWGVLSIKFALNGIEYYESNNGLYAVNQSRYLILNNGTVRSSYIRSAQEVESFTISFSPQFESEVVYSLVNTDSKLLDDPFNASQDRIEYTERLYEHNEMVSPVLYNVLRLSQELEFNNDLIAEQLSMLIEGLVKTQAQVWNQMRKVQVLKPSTKKELYIRLHRAKDYIYSSYQEDVSLKQIANVACLNTHYCLREFKKMFAYTPNQYLQQLRMNEANRLITETDKMINEICVEVGFSDHASFTKLFKRYFAESPSTVRRQQLISKDLAAL